MSDPISKKAIPIPGSWADEVQEKPNTKQKTEPTDWYGATKKEAAQEQSDADSTGVRKKGW